MFKYPFIHFYFQGFLYKKGHKVTNWKERWFIATPKVLKYYSGKDMKEKKGQMAISPTSKVEVGLTQCPVGG